MAETSPLNNNNKKSKFAPIIIIYLLALVILIGVIYAFPKASGALSPTETLEYGSIQISDNITCYFIRNENIYFANKKGKIGYNVQEGEAVRKGTNILTIKPESKVSVKGDIDNFTDVAQKYLNGDNLFIKDKDKLQARIDALNAEFKKTSDENRKAEIQRHIAQLNSAITGLSKSDQKAVNDTPVYKMGIVPDNYNTNYRGIVSYYLDGYEYAMNPDTMSLLDKDKLDNLKFDQTNICLGAANSGDPVYKIMDNEYWYAVAWIDPQNFGKYSEGGSVKLELPLGEVNGTIKSINEDGKKNAMVIMEFNTYYPDLGKLRKADTKVITSDSDGLLVSNDCITSQNDTVGVYVKGVTGQYKFTPIKVKASDGKYSILVAGYYYESSSKANESKKISTVDVYDEVKKDVAK